MKLKRVSSAFLPLRCLKPRPRTSPPHSQSSGGITAVAAVLVVKTSSTAAAEQVWTLAVHALGVGGEEAVA